VLVIETTKGGILVEMAPEAAPAHVERIKLLTREKVYDGLVFHRVIDQFMAQTGDPLGTGEGQSSHPDIKGEFTWRRDAAAPVRARARLAGQTLGFSRTLPIATQPNDLMIMTADKKVAAWGLYCPGVAGMARGEDNDSANSQFFLMRQPYPSLEKRYTAVGSRDRRPVGGARDQGGRAGGGSRSHDPRPHPGRHPRRGAPDHTHHGHGRTGLSRPHRAHPRRQGRRLLALRHRGSRSGDRRTLSPGEDKPAAAR
jgi:cyclophilin family peptidyl-prolyl cis-trans isomerase